MKAEMNKFGTITLSPETTIEAYALARWCDESLVSVNDLDRGENKYWRGSRLLISADIPAQPAKEETK